MSTLVFNSERKEEFLKAVRISLILVIALCGLNPPMTHKGYTRLSYVRQDPYVAFNDIPYAKPPEGLERCQAPKSFTPVETVDPATSTREIDAKPKRCTQIIDSQDEGSLDCLYLNVYLPKKPEHINKLLPVLVYIHGGGFAFGCNAEEFIPPDLIVQHNLVFVTLNYRLGAFGFLNLGTEEVPGNAGLKDQAKALEWIRDNIICFKGDPNNVTISGHSAGATCVNLHLMSETSKDLFHKAIVQSGGVYCPWGFRGHQRKQRQVLLSDEKFNQLLVDPDSSNEFQNYTASLIKLDRLVRHRESISALFGPTVENSKEGAFVPYDLEIMMENLIDFDKPVMAGIAKEEGILHFRNNNTDAMYADLTTYDEIFCKFLMDNLRWSDETAKKYSTPIKQKYFPTRLQTSKKGKDQCLQNFIRDIYFRRFYDNFKFGPKKTLPEKLYVYRFDHVSEISAVKRFTNRLESFNDATHGDEVYYLYCSEGMKESKKEFIFEGPNQNPEIKEVMDHVCSLWANFCKDGIPKSNYDSDNVKWRSHSEDAPCFLSISKNLRLIEEPLFKEEWGWLNAVVTPQTTLDSPGAPE